MIGIITELTNPLFLDREKYPFVDRTCLTRTFTPVSFGEPVLL
jgi:hypothetical protein